MARLDRMERAQTAVGVALVGCGVLLMCVAALQVWLRCQCVLPPRTACCWRVLLVLCCLHVRSCE